MRMTMKTILNWLAIGLLALLFSVDANAAVRIKDITSLQECATTSSWATVW